LWRKRPALLQNLDAEPDSTAFSTLFFCFTFRFVFFCLLKTSCTIYFNDYVRAFYKWIFKILYTSIHISMGGGGGGWGYRQCPLGSIPDLDPLESITFGLPGSGTVKISQIRIRPILLNTIIKIGKSKSYVCKLLPFGHRKHLP
jgi:hypothetical protein